MYAILVLNAFVFSETFKFNAQNTDFDPSHCYKTWPLQLHNGPSTLTHNPHM